MEKYGIISSIDLIGLAKRPLVAEFDAAHVSGEKTVCASKKAVAKSTIPENVSAPEVIGTPPPETADKSEALLSNACVSQALGAETSVYGEYLATYPAKAEVRKVEPISRAILSSPDTTMQQLHQMSEHELGVLDALNNDGRQTIKTRLMVIWEEMSVRFERGESINGISGTGGKGMGKYLRSLGVDPSKRRSWKFEIRRHEALQLAQEKPPLKRPIKRKEIIINSQTEADLIAKAGVRMALMSAGDNMTAPQERASKVNDMAKDIIEAIEGGRYDRLELADHTEEAMVPQLASFEMWKSHRLPAGNYKVKYFDEASRYFVDRYRYAYQGSSFKKILAILKDKPEKVLLNAHDFFLLAALLRGAAENANLLAAVIIGTLNPPPERVPEPIPAPVNGKEPAQQNASDQTSFPQSQPETQDSKSAPVSHTKLEQAISWLRRYLGNGPMPIPDSYIKSGLCRYNYAPDALPPEGIGKKTIDRAIISLGVGRIPSGPRGGIRWHLPLTDNHAAVTPSTGEILPEATIQIIEEPSENTQAAASSRNMKNRMQSWT
jgi:hypothetical protein